MPITWYSISQDWAKTPSRLARCVGYCFGHFARFKEPDGLLFAIGGNARQASIARNGLAKSIGIEKVGSNQHRGRERGRRASCMEKLGRFGPHFEALGEGRDTDDFAAVEEQLSGSIFHRDSKALAKSR